MLAARAFDDAPPEWDVTLYRSPPDEADVVVAVGCEVAGAIPFDPLRTSLVTTEIEGRLAPRGHRMVAVVGASGGCGSTSVALHLAAEASRLCLLASPDPTGLAYRLGLDTGAVGSVVPVPGGFKAVAAEPDQLVGTVSRLADRFDSVVADAKDPMLSSLLHRCDAAVLVLNPTIPSARRAAELLDAWPDCPWAVVTNRLGPGGETTAGDLQSILGCRICLELPCSRGLRDAEGESRLLSPWLPWRRRVSRLARALELR